MKLGQTIRILRKARGMKQKDLAKLIGVSCTRMNFLETERTRINPRRMVDIANALDIDVEILILLSTDPKLAKQKKYKDAAKLIVKPIIEYLANGTFYKNS